MTIKIALSCLFTCVISLSTAQQQKSAELKPIHHQGFRYYYGFKKVYGGAKGIQIPLQSLNDDEVDRRYNNFRKFRTAEVVVSLVPVAYLAANFPSSRRRYFDATSMYTVIGASLVAIIGLDICAKHQIKKGIDRYNEIILAPSTSSVGASLTYTF